MSSRRAQFTEVKLLAVHTTSLLNPRAALGWEAQPKGKFDEELHVPGGQSRRACTLARVCSVAEYASGCAARQLTPDSHALTAPELGLCQRQCMAGVEHLVSCRPCPRPSCVLNRVSAYSRFVPQDADHVPGGAHQWYHCARRQLLRNNWIATLNAALRALATREDIPLIDVEALHLQLPAAHCHKPDGFHPQVRVENWKLEFQLICPGGART